MAKKNGAARRRRVASPARVRGVRDRVIAMLMEGESTRAQMLEAGGFSMAALDGHLKKLQAEGAVSVTGKHPKMFRLSAGAVDAKAPAGLESALASLTQRLLPVRRFQEKVLVLEVLAAVMPMPVAEILNEIRADYQRLLLQSAVKS